MRQPTSARRGTESSRQGEHADSEPNLDSKQPQVGWGQRRACQPVRGEDHSGHYEYADSDPDRLPKPAPPLCFTATGVRRRDGPYERSAHPGGRGQRVSHPQHADEDVRHRDILLAMPPVIVSGRNLVWWLCHHPATAQSILNS